MRFSVAGDLYAVTCDDPDLRDQVLRWTSLLRVAEGKQGPFFEIGLAARGPEGPTLYEGDEVPQVYGATEDLVPALERTVFARLRRPERRLAVLHAAVLARGRRAVLFRGPSGAGKSVLSLTLSSRGWKYLSDEVAPIDVDARVLALPRPITFDAAEIEPALLERVARGLVTWSDPYYGVDGDRRAKVLVLPPSPAAPDAAFEIAAIFDLEKRPGGPPRMRRLSGPATRAWLFAHATLAARQGA